MELFSVMVTGANRGIGLEMVRQLGRLNPPPKHVFATYRDRNTIQELKSLQDAFQITTKIHLIRMDVTNEDELHNAFKIVQDVVREKGLTLLINNAAVLKLGAFPNLTKDELNLHFTTNTIPPILLAQIFYPLLKLSAGTRGSKGMSFSRAGILTISSMGGSIANTGVILPFSLQIVGYIISKAGLNMGMRAIAADAKKDDIIVIMMCPGSVKTDMSDHGGEIEANQSVQAIFDTLPKLNETNNGTFIDRFGNPIPY